MAGKFFEEFHVGDHFTSRARTITEADVVYYAGFTGDYNPLHTDHEFASKTLFGQRIAHGMVGASIAIGLWYRIGLTEGTAMALLETDWKFVGPIFFGDTVHTEATILETRRLSKPGRGLIRVGLDLVNQRGETVQKGTHIIMIRSNPELAEK